MKKTLTLIISFALVAAIAIGGTLAYLSSNAEGTNLQNTFTTSTAGSKLAITLDEAPVNNLTGKKTTGVRVNQNSYPVIPGETMDKDPTVTVLADSAPCYVFVYITESAKVNNKTVATIGAINSNWSAVPQLSGLYVYTGTNDKIVPTSSSNNILPAVFTTIRINPDLTTVDTASAPEGAINVRAYAYQASGDVTYDNAVAAAVNLFTASST